MCHICAYDGCMCAQKSMPHVCTKKHATCVHSLVCYTCAVACMPLMSCVPFYLHAACLWRISIFVYVAHYYCLASGSNVCRTPTADVFTASTALATGSDVCTTPTAQTSGSGVHYYYCLATGSDVCTTTIAQALRSGVHYSIAQVSRS